jgi:hypothetical protein
MPSASVIEHAARANLVTGFLLFEHAAETPPCLEACVRLTHPIAHELAGLCVDMKRHFV